MKMKNIILLAIFIGFSNIVLADNKEKSIDCKNTSMIEVTNTSSVIKLKNDTITVELVEARTETSRLVDNYVKKVNEKLMIKIENGKNRK